MPPPAHSLPFWLLQRQITSEPVGEDALLLKGPNLPVHEVRVQAGCEGWTAALYALPDSSSADGSKVLLGESRTPLVSPQSAWEAAFELYRQQVIV